MTSLISKECNLSFFIIYKRTSELIFIPAFILFCHDQFWWIVTTVAAFHNHSFSRSNKNPWAFPFNLRIVLTILKLIHIFWLVTTKISNLHLKSSWKNLYYLLYLDINSTFNYFTSKVIFWDFNILRFFCHHK